MDEGYPEFGRHLNNTGRQMIYSCSWPVYQIYAGINVYLRNMCLMSFLCIRTNFDFSQISLQSLSIVTCGETMMIFKIPGHLWKQLSIIMEITKML